MDEFGLEGYGAYWLLLEAIAEQCDDSDNVTISMSPQNWRKVLPFYPQRLAKFAQCLGNLQLFSVEVSNSLITISCPKLLKYRDEYTDRKSKKSGVCREKVLPRSDIEQSRVEQKKRKALVSEDRDSLSGASHTDPARAQKRPNCPYAEIVSAYHECLPQLPPVVSLGTTAKATLRARWTEDKKHQTLDFWREMFSSVSVSDFLMGRVKEWRCPGLLWIIGPKNFAKIVNGHYANHVTRTGSTLTDANARAGQAWLEDQEAVQ
jgi:hypothetical protein